MEKTNSLLEVFAARGFLHQCTNREGLEQLFAKEQVTAYIGYDATAGSLHVGSLVTLMAMRWLHKAGHCPLFLLGGGTSKIGDPSGRDETRKLLSNQEITKNAEALVQIFSRYAPFDGDHPALLRNNADWLDKLEYIPFLREVGRHFTLNRMLTFDSVKSRLEREQPLTFLEFNYMVLQAWDFLQLSRDAGCKLQMGGSDQWGNIVCGIELARRIDETELFGLTLPLVTTADGAKMGKTAAGAVWLDGEKLSVGEFWQYWRNTADADVGKFLRLFTELPLDEIARLEKLEGREINEAKIRLANETTSLCHGESAAVQVAESAQAAFAGGDTGAGTDEQAITQETLGEGLALATVLHDCAWVASRSEARRLIKGGGVALSGEKVDDENFVLTSAQFMDGVVQVSIGRRRKFILRLK